MVDVGYVGSNLGQVIGNELYSYMPFIHFTFRRKNEKHKNKKIPKKNCEKRVEKIEKLKRKILVNKSVWHEFCFDFNSFSKIDLWCVCSCYVMEL